MKALGSIITLILALSTLFVGAHFDGVPGLVAGLFWAGFFVFAGGSLVFSGPLASAMACVLAFVVYIASFLVWFVVEYVVCGNASQRQNLSAFYSTRYFRDVADAPVWLVSTVSGRQNVGLLETGLIFGTFIFAMLVVCIVAAPKR